MNEPGKIDQNAQGTQPQDSLDKTKNLYNVSGFEVFWRNFIAGFSRMLGSTVVLLSILATFGLLFYYFVFPRFMPLLDSMQQAMRSIGSLGELQNQFTAPQQGQQFTIPDTFQLPENFQLPEGFTLPSDDFPQEQF